MGKRTSPSGEELPPAFIAADEALVALELEMTVFNVEREEHASRIARKEIGQRLRNIPLDVLEIEVLEDEDDDDESEDDTDEETEATDENEAAEDEAEVGTEDSDETSTEETATDSEGSSDADDSSDTDTRPNAADDSPDDDVLPEFEELIDE